MVTLVVKNMVCPRCIRTVEQLLTDAGVVYQSVSLGEILLSENLLPEVKQQLSEQLASNGFEILEDRNSRIISKIKSIIIDHIHYAGQQLKVNFSSLLSSQLNVEYTSLSRLFSSVEGITIERYITLQKIEKVKELMFYNELTLSEIAYEMNYSSVAHLSAQFRKETGMTPTEFRKMNESTRKSIDTI